MTPSASFPRDDLNASSFVQLHVPYELPFKGLDNPDQTTVKQVEDEILSKRCKVKHGTLLLNGNIGVLILFFAISD